MVISGVRADTTATFGAGPDADSVIDVVVQINDDQVGLEAVEMFSVSLALTQSSDAAEVGQPNVAVISIIDDDGKCIIFFCYTAWVVQKVVVASQRQLPML